MKNSSIASAFLALALTSHLCAAEPTTSPSNNSQIAAGGNETRGFDMAPETNEKVVAAAVAEIPTKLPPGPFQPTWDSLKQNYKTPRWFSEAKFGLFMHFGLYAVPAHHNEWYEKHMYAADLQWHTEHFGPPATFGYKDFIPQFTCEKFNADQWAELFKKSGAKYVIPTAQHHDNFSLWDSKANPINAKNLGPHRDLIGELATAIRKQGLKFGVSNHGIEAFQFVNPTPALRAELEEKKADLFDPKWADWYHVADRSDDACKKFLTNWAQRNIELIDQYHPDMLWFDNGVDMRYLDPLKLWVAAYYYNRAAQWNIEVSISTKKAAYAPSGTNTQTIGSIIDFEKIGARSPAGIRTGDWQVDDPIGSTWGYTDGERIASPASIISRLVDTVSKNGNYLLNLSPKADGTIPDNQQQTLLAVGQWLTTNGEAIYATHNFTQFSDTPPKSPLNIRFTVKDQTLYAIILGKWPGQSATIHALATNKIEGAITRITMLGNTADLLFTQSPDGLTVALPNTPPCDFAYTLKIEGLKTNPPTPTPDGNPLP